MRSLTRQNVRGNFTGAGADVVAEDERHDLAILRMRANPFTGELLSGFVIGDHHLELLYGKPRLSTDRPEDGEAIAISGYPLANPILVTTSGAIAAAWNYDIAEVSVPDAPQDSRCPT